MKIKVPKQPKTLAEKIESASSRLSKYFTSHEVIVALKSAYGKGLTIHRGAVNAAIETLARHKKMKLVRRGGPGVDSIWTHDGDDSHQQTA